MLRNGNKCGKKWDSQATIPSTNYGRSKTAQECGLFL